MREEMLVAVNKSDHMLGPVERLKAHSHNGILHRGNIITVKNYENQIYLTRRSEERPDLSFPAPFPLYWDGSIAGHPRWGQKGYSTQALVELKEELNLVLKRKQLRWIGKFYYNSLDNVSGLREREICAAWVLYTNQEPVINPVEISQGEWVDAHTVKEEVRLGTRRFTPWFIKAQQLYPEIYEFNPKIKV